MGQCWRERTKRKECPMSKCCYDASCHAVFEYWKFSNSKQWKKMLKEEMEKERQKAIAFLYPKEGGFQNESGKESLS